MKYKINEIHLDCEKFFKDIKFWKGIKLKNEINFERILSGHLYNFIWIIILLRISQEEL